MEIRIDNLTEDQRDMLDFMWNELETLEDFDNWLESLTKEDQATAIALQRLILLESMEEFLSDTTLASEYLKKFML